METYQIWVPRLSEEALKMPLVNCVPLSVMMRFGMPNRHTKPLMNLTAALAGIPHTCSTSGHLVNLSMATKRKR